MKKIFTAIKYSLKDICLIDKILILYMIILFAYTAIHLFSGDAMQESSAVDTIIRTSASAIFGYFISNNFVKSNSGTKPENIPDSNGENANICCSNLQIIVVSGIGLISLVFLLVSKKFIHTTPEILATISQLRDFLSACIGFLVSCGKAKK